MIALLTIHYHSLETLCIQSDGGRVVEVVVEREKRGGGGGREREGFGSGWCLFAGGPAGKAI